jgi:hypothetical protein
LKGVTSALAALIALGGCSDQIHLGSAPLALPAPDVPDALLAPDAAVALLAPDAADVPDATPAPPYWFADHETGDLSQWFQGGPSAGDQILSTDAQLTVVTSPTHSGRFAVRSAIFAANKTSYARLYRWGNLPNDAYFRVWMWIPQRYTIGLYWNVFEFQGRTVPTDPSTLKYLWSLDLEQASNGEMSWYLFDDVRQHKYLPQVTTVAPTGHWFLVEAFMHQAMDNTGRVTFWIDGNLLVDVSGVSTVPSSWLSWNVGGSASNITQQPAELFLDDAAIAPTGPEK